MKTYVLALLLSVPAAGWAQTISSAALAQRLNQLMRDSQEPETEVRVSFTDCHFTQVIRKYRTKPANEATAIQVSHQKNGAEWAVKTDDRVEFELKLGSDWAQVQELTYAPAHCDKTHELYYKINIRRQQKTAQSSSNTTFELPLYTTNEAEVQRLVKQLNQLRSNCGGR
ncbi:hypothetical protein [Hymenobacter pini]|uniref:hypothetical protein n=1 Tax=Hymenobacter pini TaxID=2880879 RepID=UPI001CF28EEC|nr:hypothetical protein [Hymenobacter pini]MCA8832083.1 hypothetical protein [Hymenobacter pini]